MQPSTPSEPILYFRFLPHVTEDIQQVEYDLLQTNLSQHRGVDATANDLARNGYWAVVATSEDGLGDDAIEYTTNFLRSMADVDPDSITTEPPKG